MADDSIEVEGKDLGAMIAAEIAESTAYDKTELSGKRALALNYMRGDMTDLPARPNGSTQTSRDTADTVAWLLPGIVRVFTASDQMVTYDKVKDGPDEDRWSRDATDYTNYTFFRESDGYRILYNGTYDSLVLGNGVACSYWEPPKIEAKTFSNKTPIELASLLEDGWKPTGTVRPGTEPGEMEDPNTGAVTEVPTLTVALQRETKPGKICDVTCLPENLLLNSTATTIEDARFVAYLHDDKTRSDLMEMAEDYGWDADVIENMAAYRRVRDDNEVAAARYRDIAVTESSPTKSGDPIDLYECYIKADMNGDGIAEQLRVWYAGDRGGGAVLGHEEWDDDIPYTDIPCYPVPHRFDAESVYDRTADIGRVKTVLLRQMLDNGYASNLPMREVTEGSVLNPDILVNPKFGGLIWKKNGSAPIVSHAIPFVADKLMIAFQYLDEMLAKRTGVSRATMALDPEALQNQTATASQNQRDAGYSQVELIARNHAELGWAKFFAKRLRLAIKYQQVRRIPDQKADGGFREVDPSQWDPSMAVTINVGLGTGSRDRDMAMLNNVQQGQIGMAQMLKDAGFSQKAIEFVPLIRSTAVKIAESAGLRNPDQYYPDISPEDMQAMMQKAQQPPENPVLQIEKAKLESTEKIKAAELEAQVKLEEQKITANGIAEKQKADGNYAKEMAQMQADERIENVKLNNQLTVEEIRAKGDIDLQREKLAFERYKVDQNNEIEREKMGVTVATTEANNAARSAQAAQPKPNGGTPA